MTVKKNKNTFTSNINWRQLFYVEINLKIYYTYHHSQGM